jgi:hypothetical protein
MNCPGHIQIFKQGLKSYRDLPLRFSEYGSCHRNEPSGALHGIMRVRAFTQDDAHIFCTDDQIGSECKDFCDLLMAVYKDFGFTDVKVKLSDRPAVRAGSDEVWDRSEVTLKGRRPRPGSSSASIRARARSTVRSWSSCFETRSGATGSAALSRWTMSSRSGSTPLMSARTGRSTGRSCCTGPSSGRWSASSAS